MEERKDLTVVSRLQGEVRGLLFVRPGVLHAVLLFESLDLTVSEHRKPRHGHHKGTNTEVLVLLAELSDGGVLVGVVHKVHESLEYFRVELQGVLNRLAILGVLLVLEHVHKGAVVDPVHTEGPHKVPFHHPERLGQEEGVRDLLSYPIDHLSPELLRYSQVELLLGNGVVRPGGYGSPGAGLGVPESLNVFFREGHGGVETNDRKVSGHVENVLDHRLSDFGIEKIELGGVVPRHTGAVVSVVDVPFPAAALVHPLEDHRGVGSIVVVVLQVDSYSLSAGEVLPGEGVGGVRGVVGLNVPVRMLVNPAGVDAGVVGHHVACEPYSPAHAAASEAFEGLPAAELPGDLIVVEGVGGGCGLGVAGKLLDSPGGAGALPEADEPEGVKAPHRYLVQGFVGNLVEAPNGALVLVGELGEPDEGALGEEHHLRHPLSVRGEALRLELLSRRGTEPENLRRPRASGPTALRVLLPNEIDAPQEPSKEGAQE